MTFAHHLLSTVDIKASARGAPVGTTPDELMIDWTTLPPGATASLFWPSVDATAILTDAARLYGYQPFTPTDAHTVRCKAQGVTFMPIPPAAGNLAGLIDVALPVTVKPGAKITVTVSQLTNANASVRGEPKPLRASPRQLAGEHEPATAVNWRKVVGTFRLALKVASKAQTLPIVERELSLLLWIFAALPSTSRWYPIFVRYIGALGGQIRGLGGDPSIIAPSPTGTWAGGRGQHESYACDRRHPSGHAAPHCHRAHHITGKIGGLIYDHFGDFEGFSLETSAGRTVCFFTREANMEALIQRAWVERLRVTVTRGEEDERQPHRVVLHPSRQAH